MCDEPAGRMGCWNRWESWIGEQVWYRARTCHAISPSKLSCLIIWYWDSWVTRGWWVVNEIETQCLQWWRGSHGSLCLFYPRRQWIPHRTFSPDTIITSSFILHNICRKCGAPLDEPVDATEVDSGQEAVQEPQQRLHQARNAARQTLNNFKSHANK